MQLPSSWTRARVKAGLFAPPGTPLPPIKPDRAGRVRGSLVLLRVFHVKNGTFFALFSGSLYWEWIFFGISILGLDFWSPDRPRAASRPGWISKSSSFARTTGPRMLILLQAQISKKSGICPYNRTPDADPVIGANTKRFRPPPPGTPRTLPMMMMIKIKIKIKDKSKNKNKK